jgi:D-xylose transport system ATP-binding protein
MSTGETLATRERGNGASKDGTPLLSLRGVGKSFGPVRALSNVDLDVPAGQITALAGDNGAGKSVTIKTISGLWPPDEGELLWDGKPVHLHGPKDAEALGIRTIYQDLALCDNLDIVQNMFLGHETLSRGLLDEDSMEIAARKTLEELRVRTIRSIRMPVASLSGGQRQSVAVAKAVLFEAQLVIMDEPTAALGVSQTRQVLDLIKRLSSQGVAVLLVSHNLNDVFEVADRIAVLYLGRMVAVDDASKFDRQSVVEYMTTGQFSGAPPASAPVARDQATPAPGDHAPPGSQGQAPERKEA